MDHKLEVKLIKDFPKLYAGVGEPVTRSLMRFGFCCGDGWEPLIRRLSEKLEPLGVEAAQVKEKFGGLRFYLAGGATDEVYDLISAAEAESFNTCERCGKPGTADAPHGWVTTLCEGCRAKRKAENG